MIGEFNVIVSGESDSLKEEWRDWAHLWGETVSYFHDAKQKGETMKDMWKGLAGGAILMLVALVFIGTMQKAPAATGAITGETEVQRGGETVAVTTRCPDTGLTSLQASVRNDQNSSLDYIGPTLQAYYSNGEFAGNATANAGSSENYATISVECPSSGTIYAFGSAALNSPKAVPFVATKSLDQARMVGTRYNNVNLQWRNVSGTQVGTASQTANFTAAEGMTTGSSNTKILDIDPAGSSSCVGHETEGVIIAVDLDNTARFSVANGIAISGKTIPVTKMATCPADLTSSDSADVCYKAPRICTADGLQQLNVVVRSDVGDPTTADNPIIYLETPCYFQTGQHKLFWEMIQMAQSSYKHSTQLQQDNVVEQQLLRLQSVKLKSNSAFLFA